MFPMMVSNVISANNHAEKHKLTLKSVNAPKPQNCMVYSVLRWLFLVTLQVQHQIDHGKSKKISVSVNNRNAHLCSERCGFYLPLEWHSFPRSANTGRTLKQRCELHLQRLPRNDVVRHGFRPKPFWWLLYKDIPFSKTWQHMFKGQLCSKYSRRHIRKFMDLRRRHLFCIGRFY